MRAFGRALSAVALTFLGCGDPAPGPILGNRGAIRVELASSGLDQPNRSGVTVTMQPGSTQSFATAAVVFSGLADGPHTLTLDGIGANCSVQGENPRTISLAVGAATGDTVRTTFERSCVAVYGVVEVSVTTSGNDQDHDGYALYVGGTQGQSEVRDGTKRFEEIGAGEHQVRLDGVAANCAVENGTQRAVAVTTGGSTRDTVRTAFQVTCASVQHIAFTRASDYYGVPHIVISHADGREAREVTPKTSGHSASWSPDGRRLVFVAQEWCYYGCVPLGLAVADVSSGGVTRLPGHATDLDPAWSPDGTQIAFVQLGNLKVMNADGSSVRTLVARDTAAGTSYVQAPAWSPDGMRIAFTCVTPAGRLNICLTSMDGKEIVRLSDAAWHYMEPSWSPDGTRLAITAYNDNTTRQVGVLSVDGSQVLHLTAGHRPAWSPDGARLLFAFSGSPTRARGIFSVSPDGSNLARVTTGEDDAPAWRK